MGVAVAVIVLADLLVIGVCVLYLTRAGETFERRWVQQRETLESVRGALAQLIGEADVRAQEFERVPGAREKHLRQLLYELAGEEKRLRRAQPGATAPEPPPAAIAEEVRRLAATGLGAVEVARRLDADPAEVRLMLELQGRVTEGRAGSAAG